MRRADALLCGSELRSNSSLIKAFNQRIVLDSLRQETIRKTDYTEIHMKYQQVRYYGIAIYLLIALGGFLIQTPEPPHNTWIIAHRGGGVARAENSIVCRGTGL